MNHPTMQQQHAWPGTMCRAVLVAMLAGLIGPVGAAQAADAWLAAETAATMEITAPAGQVETDDTGPITLWPAWTPRMYVATIQLGRVWQPAPLRVQQDRIGQIWRAQPTRIASMQSGPRIADTTANRWPAPPAVGDVSVYLPRALLAAKAGQWDVLAAEMQPFEIDPSAVAQAAPDKPKDSPSMDASFGGELDPAWTADKLAERIKKMQSYGFSVPIVPVRQISGDWRKDYDAFFTALEGKVTPMLGLCVGKMDVPDLLAAPEFLRRYEGKYHSVIVNYDLTNGNVDGKSDSAPFREATSKVSLALMLTHRAVPSSFAWLAVGYHRTPSWASWIGAFNRDDFSGVLLSGNSAVTACMHPEAAKLVRKHMAKEIGAMPLGLIDFRLHTLDVLMFGRDDLGIQRYATIRTALKQAGIAPLHIRYTAGH